jgi:hypothetical protein
VVESKVTTPRQELQFPLAGPPPALDHVQAPAFVPQMETGVADPSNDDITRATASLPGLEIEIVHRRSRDSEAEALSITLQAMPSFEAFGRSLEAANPLAFWAQAMQLAWLPLLGGSWLGATWLGASRALMLPWTGAGAVLNAPKLQPSAQPDDGKDS